MKRTRFVIGRDNGRERAIAAVRAAEEGATIDIGPTIKSREQERLYHALIGEITEQWLFLGRVWDPEDMKRLLIDQFRRDTSRDPEFADLWKSMGTVDMAPSIDGQGVVALGLQSRKFPKKLATLFVEWLFAFGAEHGVVFSETQEVPLEAYDRR